MDAEESQRIVIKRNTSAFSKDQRVGLGLVIGIGGLAFIMGIFYVGSHLTGAFDVDYDGPLVLTPALEQKQALIELQNSDTDSDSISDYEELYLYRTSPYLADTDGDGQDDAAELALGSDPNCAAGETCGSALEDPYETVNNNGAAALVEPTFETIETNLEFLQEITSQQDPGSVREFLIENGVDESLISDYSDEELLALYQEVVAGLDDSGELDLLLQEEPDLQ